MVTFVKCGDIGLKWYGRHRQMPAFLSFMAADIVPVA